MGEEDGYHCVNSASLQKPPDLLSLSLAATG